MHIKNGLPFFAVLLFLGRVALGQPSVSLTPPPQTWIYNLNASAYVPVPPVPVLNLGASFSIEFWMLLNRDVPDGQYMRVFSKAGDYELDVEPGTHQLTYSLSTHFGRVAVSLQPGLWYHVAMVRNSLQVTLYLNGQQQDQFTASGQPPINSSALVLAGQAYGDGTKYCCGFPGILRQFRIWGRALQPTEITSFSTTLLSGNEPGLIADWPFDDGTGDTFHDVGPNHLELHLVGDAVARSTAWMRTAIFNGGPYFRVQRLTVLPSTIQSPVLTIPIDFDSDGNIDLLECQAYAATAQPCAAFRNDGRGNFSDVTTRVLGPNPPRFETARDFAVADFNGDGRADVFIANTGECFPFCGYGGGQSALLLQTPDGRLEDATAAAGFPVQRMFTHNVAAGDIDGDGDVDLFLANVVAGSQVPPQIWVNDGHGHFTVGDANRLPASLQPGGLNNYGVAKFIDVNRNGHLALLLATDASHNHGPSDLLLLNDGHGFFTLAPDNAMPSKYGGRQWGTVSFQVADFDADGWPDLINAVNYKGDCEGAIQVLLNNHDGTFRDATDRIIQPTWPHCVSNDSNLKWLNRLYPADFNGDGFLDLLVEPGPGQPPRLFLNTGPTAGSRLLEVTDLLPPLAQSETAFGVADFNGDGSQDIAAWTCCDLALESWLSSRKFTVTPDLIPPVPTGPFFLRGSVLNSADFSGDPLAPGQLVTIFGRNLGPDTLAVASADLGFLPSKLAGTRVLFNGNPAALVYTSAGAVTTIVPFSVAPQSHVDVTVEYQGIQSQPVSIFAGASAPGLFTADSSGGGQAAVFNFDTTTGTLSLNGPQNPAPPGGTIVAYITGSGQTDPPSIDGAIATAVGRSALPVVAGLDFWGPIQPVEVLYAGPGPGIVAGVIQINMRLPDTQSASGTHMLGVSVGGVWSQMNVTISVR